MAKTKKRSATALKTKKKKVATKPAARKAARKHVKAKKTAGGKKKTAGKKRTSGARKKVATRRDFINPQRQLEKLLEDADERPGSRGLPTPAGATAADGPAMPDGFFSAYSGAALTEDDYAAAARALACDVAAVKAVAEVETAGASFDSRNRPTILYERHVFSRNTVPPGKFDQAYPDLSARKPYPPGGYGRGSAQFGKLARALQLDRNAALKAPSWGKFQVLGENFKACGFSSVADFVKAMTTSEGEHLKAFVGFLLNSPKGLQAIRKKDWAGLARCYNGSNYAAFAYDTKLKAAYEKHARPPH